MERKKLLKLIVGVTLVVALVIAIPLAGGCAPKPAPPEVAPPEVAPPEVAPPEVAPPEVAPPEVAEELPTWHLRLQGVGVAAEMPYHIGRTLDRIEKMSGGRVHIDMFSSCELVADDQLMPAVKAGTLDMSMYMSVCNPSLTSLGDLETVLPFCYVNPHEEWCMREYWGLDELIAEDYEEYGVQYVTEFTFDPVQVIITTYPLYEYEDIEGLKISSFPIMASPFIRAGASMINIPPEEFYLAGQTGVVDGLMWGGAACYSYMTLYEPYPYLLADNTAGSCQGNIIVNKDIWNSLPPDIQEIIAVACHEGSYMNSVRLYNIESEARSYWTVTRFSAEDHQKLVDNAMAELDELAKQSPRMAEALAIVKAYNDEVNAGKWNRP